MRSPAALDRYFHITERGSTVGREVRGGLATFFAMAYIVILNPLIIGLGEDSTGKALGLGPVAAATALVAAVMTIAMGLVGKYPFAMATGLGVNAFLAATVATTPGLTWPDAMGLVLMAGAVMSVLVLTGFRTAVFKAVPAGLKAAIVVGIGLFIALIGLVNAGFVRRVPDAANTTVPLGLGAGGKLVGWPTLTFVVGLVITVVLLVRKTKGAILIGVAVATVFALVVEKLSPSGSSLENPAGWSLVVPGLPENPLSWPDLGLIGQVSVTGPFEALGVVAALLLTFTILLSVFFDAMGSMTGVASTGNMLDKEGNIPGVEKVLLVDALGAVAGGGASVSSNQIYVESAAGVGEGARTGLANVVTGIMFLLALFFTPVVQLVPFEAVAPALVVVGFLMVSQVSKIDWTDWGIAIPAFFTFTLMPYTYSIADGLGAGFIAYALVRSAQGRAREVHPLMWAIAAAFLVFFSMGVLQLLAK